jgi:gluconolactonase
MNRRTWGTVATLLLSVAVFTAYGQHIVSLPRSLADSGVTVESMIPVKPQRITYCEGPAVDRNGNLFFSEQSAGIIWKVTPAGIVSKWRTNSPAYSNGLEFGPDGYLYCCERNRITKVDTLGNVLAVVTSGTGLGDVNDLSITSTGAVFFTSFSQSFWYHSRDSTINRTYTYASPAGIQFNGIEYVEEEGIVYVCMYGKNKVVIYNVGANGAVDTSSQRLFVSVNSPDGITIDANRNVYIASNSGTTGSINVYDSSGTQLGSITMRQDNFAGSNASNCVFGGPDNKTLYITGDSGAYKIQLKVPGRVKPGFASVRQRRGMGENPARSIAQPAARLVSSRNFLAGWSTNGSDAGHAAYFGLLGQRIPWTGHDLGNASRTRGMFFAVRVLTNLNHP